LPTWRKKSAILGFHDGFEEGLKDGLKDRLFITAATPTTLNSSSAAKKREQKSHAAFAGRRSELVTLVEKRGLDEAAARQLRDLTDRGARPSAQEATAGAHRQAACPGGKQSRCTAR
jgi:hypothetical protein